MDLVPLVSVITSGVLGIATASIAVWTTRTTAKVAKEQREQQRSAEAYLQVLQLAESEAQWVDSIVGNLQLAYGDLLYGVVEPVIVPEPAVTARATASALLSAFGSTLVRGRHSAWREAADSYREFVVGLRISMQLEGDPHVEPGEENVQKMVRELQPAERAARAALADAVASELGHR